MKEIKETFNLPYGIKLEIYIKQMEDGSVYQVNKKTYPKSIYSSEWYEYWEDEYWLTSFDGSHERDFPIEQVMESRITDESIPGTETFWTHP